MHFLTNKATHHKLTNKGFTLIELILFMGLFTIILFILTDTFISVVNTKLTSESNSAVVQDGTFMLTRLIYDIERAESITTPGAAGSTTASLVLVIGGVTHTYAVSGGNLVLTANSVADQLNSQGTIVSLPVFQRLGNAGGKNSVRLSFRLQSASQSRAGPVIEDFQTTVGTR